MVQLVEENVESLCLDRRNGGHGSSDRDGPIRLVQQRGEIFGDSAIEAEDDLSAHTSNLREQAAVVESRRLARLLSPQRADALGFGHRTS